MEENDENGWFKRGQLPPAGAVCEVMDGGEWVQTVVVGIDSEGFAVYESTWSDVHYDGGNPLRFRPIKTAEEIAKEQEREAYCDRIYSVLCKAERKNNRSDMAEALYEAGLRFVEKESNMEIDINRYLSEEDKKSIAVEEYRSAIRQLVQADKERILSNCAYSCSETC